MSNATAFWLRIGGHPATEIASHTPPTWETLADGGIGDVSWEFNLSPRAQHQALRPGALVEVLCGMFPVVTAELQEPDRTTSQYRAYGLSASLRKKLALDGSGNVTRDLPTAISQAIARGWKGTNPRQVSGTAAGGTDMAPISVGRLLDDYAEQTGQRWGVDGQGRLYMRPDGTPAVWITSPGSAAFGTTDEGVVTKLFGRYDAGGGIYATTSVGTDGPEGSVSLIDRGPMTLTAAQATLAGMIQRRGATRWVNGVTLSREQLTTRGGNPRSALMSVVSGQTVRALGVSYSTVSQAPWLDITIGKTRYTAGDEVIYLEPVNTAPRGVASITAAA